MLRGIVIAASTVLLLGATAPIPPALLRSDAPALEVSTTMQSVSHDEYQLLRRVVPGMYRCSVFVHDEPGSNRGFSTEDIVLAPGESGESVSTLGPLRLHFRASLSEKRDQGEMTVTIMRDEKVITRQTSRMSLQAATSESN